ncbi:oligomeric golgi complex component, COG2-domain-containing protein [Tuber borchii]|uniref:Conserved oligomeric Golgi complex subunit 2 n=1 Tax=Tuber borchii TaxID=42251 RepID=A0A2T6ZZC6_TUBBO|nr:oligomeric golgi complex component, COG2-domain-containing protein [Tuber borchii]
MSKFYFDSSPSPTPSPPPSHHHLNNNNNEEDSDDDNNPSTLPFPTPLSRDAFSNLEAPFNPTQFLASLRSRHQTLEDLRAELRARSKELERELVELVNRDYVDFVGLGGSLKGGGGRVVDLRMAKNLLTLSYRLDELSTLLLIHPPSSSSSTTTTTAVVSIPNFDDQEGESSSGGGESSTPSIPRLSRILLGYLFVTRNLLPKLPLQHPFVKMQIPRIEAVRKTLLLDLDSALKEARSSKDSDKVLVLLGFYADLDAEAEGVRALKEGGKVGK